MVIVHNWRPFNNMQRGISIHIYSLLVSKKDKAVTADAIFRSGSGLAERTVEPRLTQTEE